MNSMNSVATVSLSADMGAGTTHFVASAHGAPHPGCPGDTQTRGWLLAPGKAKGILNHCDLEWHHHGGDPARAPYHGVAHGGQFAGRTTWVTVLPFTEFN